MRTKFAIAAFGILAALGAHAYASQQDQQALKVAASYANRPGRLLDAAAIWHEIVKSSEDEAAVAEAQKKLKLYSGSFEREFKARMAAPSEANLAVLMKAFPQRPEPRLVAAALSAKERDIPQTTKHLEAAVDNGATLKQILDTPEFSNLLAEADPEFEKFLSEAFGSAVVLQLKERYNTGITPRSAVNQSELATAIEDAEQEVTVGYNAIRKELSEAERREFDRDYAEWIKRKDAITDPAARLKFIQQRIDGTDTNPSLSVAEAERQLTGAYTTLRKLMSESEKQELKREQLPWIKRKDAISDPAARSVFIQERTNELSRRIETVMDSSLQKE